MKKILFAGLLILLHIFQAAAGSRYLQTDLKPLKIGDKVPDIIIGNITNYKSTSARLSDFKGKIVIIDFWATWCGSCLKIMPELSRLQTQFKDDIVILAVTEEKADVVKKAAGRLPSLSRVNFPVVSDDTDLKKLFPHNALPHDIIIDKDGTVKAITSSAYINATTISKLLKGESQNIAVKSDVLTKPEAVTLRLRTDRPEIITSGLVTKSMPGRRSQLSRRWPEGRPTSNSDTAIIAQNIPLLALYRTAMLKRLSAPNDWPDNRVQINVRQPEKIISPKDAIERRTWNEANTYCLEVNVPADRPETLYPLMLRVLENTFSMTAAIKKVKAKCWVLNTVDSSKYKSQARETVNDYYADTIMIQHAPVDFLVSVFNLKSKVPIIDETGFKGKVNVKMPKNFESLDALNRELAAFGLMVREEERVLDFIVIRDIEM